MHSYVCTKPFMGIFLPIPKLSDITMYQEVCRRKLQGSFNDNSQFLCFPAKYYCSLFSFINFHFTIHVFVHTHKASHIIFCWDSQQLRSNRSTSVRKRIVFILNCPRSQVLVGLMFWVTEYVKISRFCSSPSVIAPLLFTWTRRKRCWDQKNKIKG